MHSRLIQPRDKAETEKDSICNCTERTSEEVDLTSADSNDLGWSLLAGDQRSFLSDTVQDLPSHEVWL